jgi:hypothetical protein
VMPLDNTSEGQAQAKFVSSGLAVGAIGLKQRKKQSCQCSIESYREGRIDDGWLGSHRYASNAETDMSKSKSCACRLQLMQKGKVGKNSLGRGESASNLSDLTHLEGGGYSAQSAPRSLLHSSSPNRCCRRSHIGSSADLLSGMNSTRPMQLRPSLDESIAAALETRLSEMLLTDASY